MDELVFRGIIIKQNNYGEAHRMLSIFTENDGIIKAVRYGVRGKKASNAAAFQMLCYGDFKLRPSKGDVMTAVSADIIDGFYPVSEDIVKLSLLTYFADITYALLGESNPDRRILSLFLNTAYAAAYRYEPYMKLKAVYELKLMCAGGYMPQLGACGICGEEAMYFSPNRGCMVCRAHRNAGDMKISPEAAALMNYIVGCPDKKMLSFSLKNEELYQELSAITEKYVSAQADKSFASLNYFKSMCEARADL